MFDRHKKAFFIALLPVTLVCMGALTLSMTAMVENLRFVSVTNNLSAIVVTVRAYAKELKTRSFSPGEDMLSKMIELGQLPASYVTNPWKGGVRATAVDNTSMRMEYDLPAHICRRIALYLFGRKPAERGLLAMEARSAQREDWMTIYPEPNSESETAVQSACGRTGPSHLAVVFKIRE